MQTQLLTIQIHKVDQWLIHSGLAVELLDTNHNHGYFAQYRDPDYLTRLGYDHTEHAFMFENASRVVMLS